MNTFQSLHDQGVDINSYMFSTAPDTTVTMETENSNAAAVASLPIVPKEEVAADTKIGQEAAEENGKFFSNSIRD